MVLDHTVDKHTRIWLGVYSQAKPWMIRYGCQTMLPRFPFNQTFSFQPDQKHLKIGYLTLKPAVSNTPTLKHLDFEDFICIFAPDFRKIHL